MINYLATRIDGYTLEVDTYFLKADDQHDAMKYLRSELGDEASISCLSNGDIFAYIPCDEHHMLKDTEIWLQLIDNIKEVTA